MGCRLRSVLRLGCRLNYGRRLRCILRLGCCVNRLRCRVNRLRSRVYGRNHIRIYEGSRRNYSRILICVRIIIVIIVVIVVIVVCYGSCGGSAHHLLHNDLLQELHLLLNDRILFVDLSLDLLILFLHSFKLGPEFHSRLVLICKSVGIECTHFCSCRILVILLSVIKSSSLVSLCLLSGNLCLLSILFHLELLISYSIVNSFELVDLISNSLIVSNKLLLSALQPLCRKNYVNTEQNAGKTGSDRCSVKNDLYKACHRGAKLDKLQNSICKSRNRYKCNRYKNSKGSNYIRKNKNILLNRNILALYRSACDIEECLLSCGINCLEEKEHRNDKSCACDSYKSCNYIQGLKE